MAGELLIGTFVKTPAIMVAEALARTRLDLLCFDAEHAPFDRRDLDASLLACRAARMPSLVRVPNTEPAHILNALDCGATGVVVPHVGSPEEAEAISACSRFGEAGRSYAGSTRAAAYGANSIADNLAHNKKDTAVVAQIEDVSALDNIDAIAAVAGIDCLYIGLMDLTVALGASAPMDAVVMEATEAILAASRTAKRRVGMFIPSADDIGHWAERGVSLFLLYSDHVFMAQGANQLADKRDAHQS